MDLDTIITFVIFVLFFILPSIFKIFVSKNKSAKSSVFGKIGAQIQKFVQELEEQGQKQEQKETQNVWEMFETQSEQPQEQFSEYPPKVPADRLPVEEPLVEDAPGFSKISSEHPAKPYEKKSKKAPEIIVPPEKSVARSKAIGCVKYGSVKAHPLQNAVVWSEILASPLALRDK